MTRLITQVPLLYLTTVVFHNRNSVLNWANVCVSWDVMS